MEQLDLKLTYQLQIDDQEFELTHDEVLQIKRLIEGMISEPKLPPYNPYPYAQMPQLDLPDFLVQESAADPVYVDRFYSTDSVPVKDPILGVPMDISEEVD